MASIPMATALPRRSAAAEPAGQSAETIRRFAAEIASVDLEHGRVTFVHAPSGYTLVGRITDKTRLARTRFFHPGDAPDGSVVETWGRIDEANRRVFCGEFRVGALLAEKDLKAEPSHNMIAGRLFREPVEHAAADTWTTVDGKAVLGLRTSDGRRWRLVYFKARPLAFQREAATRQDLHPGCKAEIVVADRGGEGDLIEVVVESWFEGAENRHAIGRAEGNGPSGMTAERFQAELQAVRDQHAKIAAELSRRMPVRMRVTPQLAMRGEPVHIEVRAVTAKRPNPKATVFLDYFHTGMKKSRAVVLDWQPCGEEAGLPLYTASVSLPSDRLGQYLVEWNCDVGGDVAKFSRSYAVCDNHSAVCLFVVTAPGSPHPEIDFHKHHVPFDYWESVFDLPQLAGGSAELWAQRSRRAREFGDNPNFLMEWYAWDTAQVCREPTEVQRIGVGAIKGLVAMMGFPDRPISTWSYTLGNVGYRLLQEAGGLTVTSLCTENHTDGGLEINHWGKPERPYFMSAEDFRKAGPGGPDRLVAFSQVQRHTYLARHYCCDFCIEAACLGGPLAVSAGRENVCDEITASRMLDGYDALFQMPRCQKTPYYIASGVEFNGGRPGATEGNRIELEYALAKARTGNVVFATTRGVAEFYKRHYTTTPESSAYFDDYWAGTHVHDKPDLLPDVMTMENGKFYALALAGQILPQCAYDYTRPWDFPDYGNDALPRRLRDPMNYLFPGKYDKYAATPHTLDTRPLEAVRRDRVEGNSLAVTITVEAKAAQKNLALALWNIPREFQPGEGWFQTSAQCRFLPVLAPYSDNLNGFLVADVAPGRNVFEVRISSAPREPKLLDFQIGASVRGKVVRRDGTSMAYLWPTGPWPAALRLVLPAGKSARAYVAPRGVLQECPPGDTMLEIPQDQWMRLVGLDREEILRFASATHR
jgi:hypothetical protein